MFWWRDYRYRCKDRTWRGVLHIAVRKRRQLDVRCFIQHGADINAKANNGFDFTPLHYSIGIGILI
ncbi:ankyrin repeat domain-containing protein [Escherichia coli]|nr:ankyrin repeat domain-containing protein [Escherichia coli]